MTIRLYEIKSFESSSDVRDGNIAVDREVPRGASREREVATKAEHKQGAVWPLETGTIGCE